ncbi:FAD-dependent monooxygenase [Actinokineospora globicatena]|uniref:FAD-dependent monooxygenase n=1 Tax=Actinokineospora globicatena TaxID=103729 RepID=UPI0020A4965A|nr:FAD-dependent monooxygenase [Actinokineospora globicatena]MCP2306761.1 2,4-dichlorophenol 6-monooxygenase [Actinokineospora globicatena]GLW82120.1 2,4-dichlorophenol 6-monooxygenase [Actinokineospora globicatena]GLW88913.1 2,4-dichlorophenol 6-monooxygenase [Actinokineospora globicatena]
MSVDETVPVLIVGGGGSGLLASVVLADLGVESLLVERHPSTSRHPKAHILNARTMEVLAKHGLADEVYAAGSPPERSSAMVWLTSLGGDEPFDRKVLHRVDAYGGGALRERYAAASAYRHGNLGQLWLEPLLRRHAEERTPGGVRFHHELLDLTQDEAWVTARIRDRDTGRVYTVRALYVIGADGGKTVGAALGVRMAGTPTFSEWINLHVRSDFSAFLDHDDAVVNRVSALTGDGRFEHCGVVPMGPDSWGRSSREWTLMVTRSPGEAAALDDDAVVAGVRSTLKLPADHPMEVVSISRWPVEGTVADRFRVGRVFLVGDAAHRHPPSGALGLNTGMQDAHNLAWKLAAVLAGTAGPALLRSYEAERRPVAERVVRRALYSAFNQISMTAGTGVSPVGSPAWNRAQLTALFADTEDGETRRAILGEYFATNRITTEHLGLELGYDYADSPCVLPDGSAPPPRDPLGVDHHPSARPGHRLPHAWLRLGDERVHTHHLVRPGRFLLLAGAAGQGWVEAATAAGIDAYRVGPQPPSPTPPAEPPGSTPPAHGGDWSRLRGHDDDGAVLVRPDGVIAARAHRADAREGKSQWLDRALRVATGRTEPTTPTPEEGQQR